MSRPEYRIHKPRGDELPSGGAVEQPMPTQEDRNTAMQSLDLDVMAAVREAEKAGVTTSWPKKQPKGATQDEEDD